MKTEHNFCPDADYLDDLADAVAERDRLKAVNAEMLEALLEYARPAGEQRPDLPAITRAAIAKAEKP